MRKAAKPLVFILALVPLAWLVFIVLTGRTSANPAEDILLTTGIWALRFLLITLAITPVRRLTGWNASFSTAGCSGCSRSSTRACTC